ncbi:TetR/AcrR family transcriptional regulator [Amycolatopsis albispora]|uniref:Transcriptional regulator n=1 Tax=Amycolatopsis albispora TaxID=1804986 RepID=A0A344L4N9_9PSEU|nr:TetR/AcrR family transcriptional regulator [Amycolatopsis albispora]AXB43013.1 transcriptional regulator [Amycolatopsis albispora]
MARPREFDEHAAIDRAMRAFWQGGYEGTSTQQLCEATGLGRSSIYNTFSSKRELFVRALQHYCDTATQHQIDFLEQPGPPPREKLRALLLGTVEDEFTGDNRGCLAVNTVAELGGKDPEISAKLAKDAERYVAAIGAVVAAGQRAGEIDTKRDPLLLARFLHSQISALRMGARGGTDRATLEQLAELALSTL